MRIHRRSVLQSIAGVAGLSALSALPGCRGGDDDDVGGSAERVVTQQEALKRIDKIVVLMMENRSFDHYFGHLTISGERQRFTPGVDRQEENDRRINGLTGDEWNPKAPGDTSGVKVFHAASDRDYGYAIGDVNHEFVECHNQWNQIVEGGRPTGRGRMDGFVIEHLRDLGTLDYASGWAGAKPDGLAYTKCGGALDPCAQDPAKPGRFLCGGLLNFIQGDEKNRDACGRPNAPMAYYRRADTPVFHSFLDNYTVCDAWHSSVMGPTWPNRFYVHGASSGGSIKSSPRSKLDTIWRVLKDARVDAINFFADVPLNYAMYGRSDTVDYSNPNSGSALVFNGQSPLRQLFKVDGPKAALVHKVSLLARDKTFEERGKDGTLPAVSFIEPPYFSADDHPPNDIRLGQAFVKAVYNMIYGENADPGQAKKTMLVVLYDEHGAFYDHADPGLATPASAAPRDRDPRFQHLGFRVPAMVVGPMVKRDYVSHTVYDHTSVLKTIRRWFELKGRPLRKFEDTTYDRIDYQPQARIDAANDITDCLELSEATRDPVRLASVRIREADAIEAMYVNEGQAGFAKTLGVGQPVAREKIDACKVVMEHLYRLGAIEIG